MTLQQTAAHYVSTRGISRRNPIYSATRFVRLVGQIPITEITTADLIAFRACCSALGHSPATIESSIGDLVTMRFDANGERLDRGHRLRIPRPSPAPATLEHISAVYTESPAWLRQYLALSYWSCLRIADVLRLQISRPDPAADVLRWAASKTGLHHVWPVPAWLKRHLAMQVIMPVGQPHNHLKRVLRRDLRIAADAAGVRSFTPQQLRQRGLSEWSRANAMAARIVHGAGLGVLDHYVDPMTVLESAAPGMRLPAAFCSDAERDDSASLPAILARLDHDARRIVMETAQRFAR